MKGRVKSFWGIVFISFLVIAVLTMLYQITIAPRRALGFISDTAVDVFAIDAGMRRELNTLDSATNDSVGYSLSDFESLTQELEESKTLAKKLDTNIKSLTQLERWALDNYGGVLELHVNRVNLLHKKLDSHIAFLAKHEDEVMKYNQFLSDDVSEILSCSEVSEFLSQTQIFLQDLSQEVKEEIADLEFQRSVIDYTSKHGEVILNIQNTLESKADTCNTTDIESIKADLQLQDLPTFTYFPQTKLYITNSYNESLQSVLTKIDSVIDKLQM